jgi:hypothetical protein
LAGGLLACAPSDPFEPLKADEATAREAIAGYLSRGESAVPEILKAAEHDDPVVRRRAKTALGRITGQWGGDGSIPWKRSLGDALGRGKPIVVLHIFGKFDEEFC